MLCGSDARFEAFDVLLGPMTKVAGGLWMNYRRDISEILGFLELLELSIVPGRAARCGDTGHSDGCFPFPRHNGDGTKAISTELTFQAMEMKLVWL